MTDKLKNLNLSVSSLETFKGCQAKWYYRYIEKLPTPDGYHSLVGKFIHKILEIYLRRYKKNGNNLRDAANVAYRLAKQDPELQPHLTEEIKKEAKQWIKDITKIYEDNPNQIPDALKIEAPFSFKIEDLNITVRGFIDRVDKVSADEIRIVDYKTSGNPKYLKPFQLATYAHAMSLKYPDKKISAAYELVRFDFERLNVDISNNPSEDVIETFKQVGTEIRQLQQSSPNKPWKPTLTKLCSYCPFRMRCEKDRSESSWKV